MATDAERKRKQRESNRDWLEKHVGFKTADAIATALRNGLAEWKWIERPEKKKVSKK